jgi:hypothetical protein
MTRPGLSGRTEKENNTMGITVHFTGRIGKTPELKGEGDEQYTTVGIADTFFPGPEGELGAGRRRRAF